MDSHVRAKLKLSLAAFSLLMAPLTSMGQNPDPGPTKSEQATENIDPKDAAELEKLMTEALHELQLEFVQAKIAKPSLWIVLAKLEPKNSAQDFSLSERQAWNRRHETLYDSVSKIWKNRLRKDLRTEDPHFELLQKMGLFFDFFLSLDVLVGPIESIVDSMSHSHLRFLLPKVEWHLATEFGFKMKETEHGLMIDGDVFFEKIRNLGTSEKNQFIQSFVTQASGYRNTLRYFIAYRDRSPSGHSVRPSDLTRLLYVSETLVALTTTP